MLNPLHKDLIEVSNQMVYELELVSKIKRISRSKLTPHQKNLYFLGLKNYGLTLVTTKRLCKKPLPKRVTALLSISFGLINSQRYSNFTIVDQSVEAAKKIHGKKLASLANFILRNILQNEKDAFFNDKKNPIAKWNAPHWWIEKIQTEFGKDSVQILNINKFHPPLTLRVAYSFKETEKIENKLKKAQTKIIKLGANSLGIIPPYDIRSTSAFKEGLISIQDLSSQKIIEFINPQKGMFILDACAAPGGKSFAIASRFSSVNIISSDVSQKRLKKLELDLARQSKYLLSLPKIMKADLTEKEGKEKLFLMSQNGFDIIVLDSPCSGSGVVRRHPEIPWNRSKEQLKKLVELQSRLLKNAWDLLKIDGTLIYSVCSIFSEEGDKQITKFLENNSDAKKIQSSLIKPSLSSNSCLTEIEENYLGSDGFFYGKLRKINI